MWIQTKLIRLVIEQRRALLKRFEESEHKPPRQSLNLNRSLGLLGSNPSFKPGTQELYRQLPPPKADQGITMNAMFRSIPRPRPPRRPGQQSRRWWHY